MPSPSSKVRVSTRSTVTISASIRWKPSGRTPVTRSDTVSFAGAITVVPGTARM
jgi:hypothetical protein